MKLLLKKGNYEQYSHGAGFGEHEVQPARHRKTGCDLYKNVSWWNAVPVASAFSRRIETPPWTALS